MVDANNLLNRLNLSERSRSYADELKNSLSDLCIFIGAGLSMTTKPPLPSWENLFERLHTKMKAQFNKSGDIIRDFNKLFNVDNKDFYINLEDEINVDNIKIRKPHELLISLPTKRRYFTTNIDILLERSFHLRNISYTKIVSEEDTPFYDQITRPLIIKLHGCIHYKSSIVFTRKDYSEVENKKTKLLDLFKTAIVQSRFLFIGYSFNSADLHIYKIIANAQSKFTSYSYAIAFKSDSLDVDDFYNNLKIKTIVLNQYKDLGAFLAFLNRTSENRIHNSSTLDDDSLYSGLSVFEKDIISFLHTTPSISIKSISKKYNILERTTASILDNLFVKGFLKKDIQGFYELKS